MNLERASFLKECIGGGRLEEALNYWLNGTETQAEHAMAMQQKHNLSQLTRDFDAGYLSHAEFSAGRNRIAGSVLRFLEGTNDQEAWISSERKENEGKQIIQNAEKIVNVKNVSGDVNLNM